MTELKDYKCPLCCADKDENERLLEVINSLKQELEHKRKELLELNGKYITLFDENHDLRKRVKELENACDEEAETSVKTNDARLAAEKEAEKWKREYYDLLQRVMNRHNKAQSINGITVAPVFDTEHFAPGKMFRVDRYVRKGDDRNFVESCNVVIVCASGQNTRLECRSIDKDNACVTIDVSRVINGEIVLSPVKIVEEE
jgi:predicted nuclease with TOPRIM domain